jgi:DNA polymerase
MPTRWSCTAARSRYYGVRASLDGAASDLEVLTQKDGRGKQFINDFCKPRSYKGAKKYGIVKELWYEPHENPQGWQIGKEYCITDGEAEADIDAVLPDLPAFEQAVWELDFKINDRGVPIDVPSVERAIAFTEHFTREAYGRFEVLTALRPTQRDKVLEYLQQREEIDILGDLKSKTLKRLTHADFPQDLQDVIQIRLDCSLASVKKLERMESCTDDDGFARGCHLYYGAHTGRFTNKRIQTGNMKRGDARMQQAMFAYLEHPTAWPQIGHNQGPPLDLLDGLEAAQKAGWVIEAEMRFVRPLATLSLSMRGFVAAPKGRKLVAGDFAQIEARVLAWLARCMWLLTAFRNRDDPYVKFGAEHMYHRDYDDCFEYVDGKRKVKADFAFQRQVSKSAVLGCGFGLGGKKFVEYCDNSDIIITEEEAKETVGKYRDAHPEVVQLWARVEQCCILATANPGVVYELGGTGVKFYTWHVDSERYWLKIELPSGRCLHYYRPKIEFRNKWGRTVEALTFRSEWNGMSYREDTYGGKIVENIVQAIARDIMAVGALNADRAGYDVRMLVHDEIVTLVDQYFGSHQELCTLMCQQEAWITDLPIEAEGATMIRYGK